MTNVIALTKPTGDDIPAALRAIADDIDAGLYDFAPTMAVLAFADEDATATGGELVVTVHGLGARCHSRLVTLGIMQQAMIDLAS